MQLNEMNGMRMKLLEWSENETECNEMKWMEWEWNYLNGVK